PLAPRRRDRRLGQVRPLAPERLSRPLRPLRSLVCGRRRQWPVAQAYRRPRLEPQCMRQLAHGALRAQPDERRGEQPAALLEVTDRASEGTNLRLRDVIPIHRLCCAWEALEHDCTAVDTTRITQDTKQRSLLRRQRQPLA